MTLSFRGDLGRYVGFPPARLYDFSSCCFQNGLRADISGCKLICFKLDFSVLVFVFFVLFLGGLFCSGGVFGRRFHFSVASSGFLFYVFGDLPQRPQNERVFILVGPVETDNMLISGLRTKHAIV